MSATGKSLATELNEPGHQILWFDDFGSENEFRFLSNFYVGETLHVPGWDWEMWGDDYAAAGPVGFATGEHAFAAMKAADARDFYDIVMADEPGVAKSLGRSIELREDWEAVKLDVMAAIIRAKFTHDRAEGDMLLGTGDALLVEGTLWGDDTWGVKLKDDGLPGRNWLGTLLMARRAELRATATHPTVVYNAEFGI